MPRYWLKVVGTSQKPIGDYDWTKQHPYLKRMVHFPRQPRRIQARDGIVLYAAGRRIVFAAGEVTSQPYQSSRELPGYPWAVDVVWDEDATVLFLRHGVPLSDIGVEGKSVRQQSHIELSEEQLREAVRALRRAKTTREEAT